MEIAIKIRTSLAAIALAVTLIAGCNHSIEPVKAVKTISADPLMKGRLSTIIGVNYVGMTVSDVDRTKAFYTSAIDLKPLKIDLVKRQVSLPSSIAPASDLRDAAILRGPNSYLRLMEYEAHLPAHEDGAMPVQGPGITHICFQAPKARPIAGKFVEQGATWQTTSKAMVDMRGVGFMYGYLRDPDGLMLEIEHAPDPKFDVDYWMGHVAMATPNMTRTIDFYEKVMGYDHYRRVDNLGGPTFSDVAGADNAIQCNHV
jgi:catechol 2,3-dioxygenase-like lactoylglutathione lyase family enzyme